MLIALMNNTSPPPAHLIGTWRRFGSLGPVYEIIGFADGPMMRIRVLESGEELGYPLAQILDDPVEA